MNKFSPSIQDPYERECHEITSRIKIYKDPEHFALQASDKEKSELLRMARTLAGDIKQYDLITHLTHSA